MQLHLVVVVRLRPLNGRLLARLRAFLHTARENELATANLSTKQRMGYENQKNASRSQNQTSKQT
jgi:hypothetical protein